MEATVAACAGFRVPARCVAGAEASTSRQAGEVTKRSHGDRVTFRAAGSSARLVLHRGSRRGDVSAFALKRAGPTTPKPTYNDGPVDRELLRAFHARVASELGEDPSAVTGDYDATMRACVRLVSSARTPDQAQARGERVLRSLLPRWFPGFFRLFIALFPRWFVARHAAAVTPMILPWLVGPARVIDAPDDLPVDDRSRPPANALDSLLTSTSSPSSNGGDGDGGGEDAKGQAPGYRQGVLLERCRVLEEGGCASVCLNVCKVPTQNFFSDLGLDVELRPDYETFECRFVYGKKPPPAGEDPAFDTPCFAQCSISKSRGGAGATDATLPRWAVDRIDGVDGVGARGAADGGASNCGRLPEFTGDTRRNHGRGTR